MIGGRLPIVGWSILVIAQTDRSSPSTFSENTSDARSDRAAAQDDPGFTVQLEQLDERVGRIGDLSADFEERKFTALLKKPLISTGTVRVKGSASRWDTQKPHATTMHIDAQRLRIYYPDRATVEVYALDRKLRQLVVSPLPRLAALREHFSMVAIAVGELDSGVAPEQHLALVLTPTGESLRQYLDCVRVLIDRSSACVRQVEMIDADGDRTVLVFRNLRTNTGLTDADVSLTTPQNTKVVRPLEGGDPEDSGAP